MKVKTFQKGEVIFKQGDYEEVFFHILSGSVGIYIAYGTENEKQINVLHEGDFLGEMGMIEACPRSATAVAMEDDVGLEEIDAAEFSEYFKTHTGDLLRIMRQMSQRLRDRTEDYEAACRALEELQQTRGTPKKRSRSLLEKIKGMIAYYDTAMAYDSWLSSQSEMDFAMMSSGAPFFTQYHSH